MLATNMMLQSRYRITSLLGRGGMGAVYRADDVRLDIAVAIKEMTAQPGLDAPTLTFLRDQFKREATILARLQHPSLVRVTDFFEEGGNAYLVMDFVVGESLDALLRRHGLLPEAQVLVWARQLLDALAYCHSQGVIHRDIKPQNVIIRSDQRAVLVDFGLVKLWDPNNPHTQTALRGAMTPAYAPLEQYGGQTGHTDPRSDLYSLGATLYHTLTGIAPYAATQRVINPALFMPPQALNPNLSPAVAAVVVRALEIQPAARFQNATEMAAALQPAPPPPSEPGTGRLVMPSVPKPTHQLGPLPPGGEPPGSEMVARPLKQRLLAELRQLLVDRFSEAELRTLCIDLSVDYESLSGQGKEAKARELLSYLQQRDRLSDLIVLGQQLRPDIDWDSWEPFLPQPATPPSRDLHLTLAAGVELILVPVPAGEFLMGSDRKQDPQARDNELPQHTVMLDEYWIGKYPVTNYQYQAFVRATGHAAPQHWLQGKIQAGQELHPVVNISWDDAVAFCAWASGQVRAAGFAVGLPTEAEWEKAARGSDGRLWPWGNARPDVNRCNFNHQVNTTTPVTRYELQGASPYGAVDMAGNVWEWVYDWYGLYAEQRQVNPVGPPAGTVRVVRGGAWCNEMNDLRCAVRGWLKPASIDDSIGMRCAAARLP